MVSSVNHGPALSAMLKQAMRDCGINRALLENDRLKHRFSPGYRKSKQIFGATGVLYCPELWSILGSPAFKDGPVFQYDIGQIVGLSSYVFELSDQLDVEFVRDHFNIIARNGIEPIVRNIQTPVQAVQYAIDHPGVIMASRQVIDRNLRKWSRHYGLDYRSPVQLKDE